MAVKPGDLKSGDSGEEQADDAATVRGLGEQQGGPEESLGLLALKRMVKDDGRALLVFRRADGQ